jgi:hypothetical protein
MRPASESVAFLGILWVLFSSTLLISVIWGLGHGWDSIVFPGKRGGGYAVSTGLVVGAILLLVPLTTTIAMLRRGRRRSDGRAFVR